MYFLLVQRGTREERREMDVPHIHWGLGWFFFLFFLFVCFLVIYFLFDILLQVQVVMKETVHLGISLCFHLSCDSMAIIAQELVHCQNFKCLTQDHTEIYVLVQPRTLETCASTLPMPG